MNHKPYLSFVVTARNDDYGGNWINRINAFLKVIASQSERTRLPSEVVFVEYNPPAGKKRIFEELTVPKNDFFQVRFITVPDSFHKKLPRNSEVTVCEFIGKNIGARRALGEFIIATNPDVLYGNELFDWFAKKEIKKDRFYRLYRRDISINFVDPKLNSEEILNLASKKVIKILKDGYTEYKSYRFWFHEFIHGRTFRLFMRFPLFNSFNSRKINTKNSLHANAAGDFLLVHKDAFNAAGGYDEITVGSGVLDGYILYMLYCRGYVQEILPYPLYHIYHHHKGVKYLASHQRFEEDSKNMMKTKSPYKPFKTDWGFPNESFEENIL